MTATSTDYSNLPHAVGMGRLAVPDTAAESGRTGAVGLLDKAGIPVRPWRVPRGGLVHVTVSLPFGAAVIDPEVPRWHLLGAGRATSVTTAFGDRPGIAVGVEPVAKGGLLWLHLPTREDLTEAEVLLEAHPAWPCPCAPDRRRAWLLGGGEAS
jgi:hypothetical protein